MEIWTLLIMIAIVIFLIATVMMAIGNKSLTKHEWRRELNKILEEGDRLGYYVLNPDNPTYKAAKVDANFEIIFINAIKEEEDDEC